MIATARILCLVLCLGLALAGPVQAKDQNTSGQGQASGKSSAKKSDKSKAKAKKSSGKSQGTASGKSKGRAPAGGFRSLAWGTPLDNVPGLEIREQTGDAKYCTLPGDDMDFDGVTMREIVYVFCRDKLAGALMRYDGVINHQALMGRLGERHGRPLESPPNYRQDRSWRFNDGEATIMLEYSTQGATGAVAYFASGLFSPCEGMAAP